MNKESRQFMACGACGVVVDGNGVVTSSFDQMTAGVRRVFKALGRSRSEGKTTPVVHA